MTETIATVGTCTHCGLDLATDSGENDSLFHADTGSEWCKTESYFPPKAELFVPKRYTVLVGDGYPRGGMLPDRPCNENQAATLADARQLFITWMRDSGNDYLRADGCGNPYASVHFTESYDGITYGDGWPVRGWERGIRGGTIQIDY